MILCKNYLKDGIVMLYRVNYIKSYILLMIFIVNNNILYFWKLLGD